MALSSEYKALPQPTRQVERGAQSSTEAWPVPACVTRWVCPPGHCKMLQTRKGDRPREPGTVGRHLPRTLEHTPAWPPGLAGQALPQACRRTRGWISFPPLHALSPKKVPRRAIDERHQQEAQRRALALLVYCLFLFISLLWKIASFDQHARRERPTKSALRTAGRYQLLQPNKSKA